MTSAAQGSEKPPRSAHQLHSFQKAACPPCQLVGLLRCRMGSPWSRPSHCWLCTASHSLCLPQVGVGGAGQPPAQPCKSAADRSRCPQPGIMHWQDACIICLKVKRMHARGWLVCRGPAQAGAVLQVCPGPARGFAAGAALQQPRARGSALSVLQHRLRRDSRCAGGASHGRCGWVSPQLAAVWRVRC